MYMAACIILCDEMLYSFISPIASLNNTQQIDKKIGFTSRNPDYEMLLPAVFNFKHGIELYLKSLILVAKNSQTYEFENKSHNLKCLVDKLSSLLKDNELIKKLGELERIVDKYYYGTYAFVNEFDRSKPDINNEAERYPEYKNNSCYQIKSLYEKVSQEIIESIIKDCKDSQKILREGLLKPLASST